MALILNIETATDICSIAVSKNKKILSSRESNKRDHASQLHVFIKEIFEELNITSNDLDAVAVSKGPGSYTGLRIGVASAKGICYAAARPLIAVNTLEAMTCTASDLTTDAHLYCPMIDARRMEVYTCLFTNYHEEIEKTQAVVLDKNFLSEHLKKSKTLFFGSGAEKLKLILKENSNALFADGFTNSAKGMISIAEKKFEKNDFENLAYFEPFYLKDFVAIKPCSSLL